MSPRDELLRLLEPPAEKWAVPGQDDIAESYGSALPDDYMWFMETYGPGEFSRYLGLLPPVVAADRGRRAGVAPAAAEPMDGVAGIEREYAEMGALLEVGATPDGDAVFWRTAGKPNEWPVVVFGRHDSSGPSFTRYECGIVEFLVGVFKGRLAQNPFSSDDLWKQASPTFERY